MSDVETPEARPGEVEFSLSWQLESGHLVGALEALNVSEHPFRLSGKPGLTPMGTDGHPLDAPTVVTLELRLPGYVELRPGERARSRVGWGAWPGPPASGRVLVQWDGGQAEVEASGPRQPELQGPGDNLSSSWFERVES
jgi:hypothetical protein